MNTFEVFTAPEIRVDAMGEYRYVAIGAWSSLAAKSRGDGIRAVVGGMERTAELFNDFKVRYAATGTRVTSRTRNSQVEFERSDGVWVRWDQITLADEAIGWNRENVVRDLDAEIQQALDRYMTRASNKGYRGDMRGTTLNLQVGASNADATEDDGGFAFFAIGSYANMSCHTVATNRYNSGFFFSGVTIPAGATINSATLTVDVINTTNDDPKCDILFNDVDSAANFTDEPDVTSRARTTASAAWVATGIGAGIKTSPDCSSALQEVIDRAGWASGNNLCVLVDGQNAASLMFQVDAYDSDTTNACKLDIDYTAAAAGGRSRMSTLMGGN